MKSSEKINTIVNDFCYCICCVCFHFFTCFNVFAKYQPTNKQIKKCRKTNRKKPLNHDKERFNQLCK